MLPLYLKISFFPNGVQEIWRQDPSCSLATLILDAQDVANSLSVICELKLLLVSFVAKNSCSHLQKVRSACMMAEAIA